MLNTEFSIGDLVVPHPDYHKDCQNIGIIIDIIVHDRNTRVYRQLVVRWQQPLTNKFGEVFWEEKMAEYMYKKIA